MIRFGILSAASCLILALLVTAPARALPPTSTEVYWDVHPATIGVSTAYTPSGRYSAMVDHLAPLGFHFTEGTAPLDTVTIDPDGILVIADGSDGLTLFSPAELNAISSFVQNGGGLLLLSDASVTSGAARMQQAMSLFGAQFQGGFPIFDVESTSIISHPAVAGVDDIYFRFSSTFSPGVLTPYAFNDALPMVAAGQVGHGRVVLIADSDALTYVPNHVNYFDMADNRQLAASTFRYLAVPEPASAIAAIMGLGGCLGLRRKHSKRYAAGRVA